MITYILVIGLIVQAKCVNTTEHTEKAECVKPQGREDIGAFLKCIGTQYDHHAITDLALEDSLFEVIQLLPSDQTYSSAGIVWGADTKLSLMKQHHYRAQWSAEVNINPLTYGKTYIQVARPISKPLLIYTQTQIPNLNTIDQHTLRWVPRGGLIKKLLMQHPDYKHSYDIPEESTSSCKLYESWTEKHYLKNQDGLAVLMPMNTWCPSAALVHFDIVVGDYKNTTEALVPIWERSNKHKFNTTKNLVNKLYPVFQ